MGGASSKGAQLKSTSASKLMGDMNLIMQSVRVPDMMNMSKNRKAPLTTAEEIAANKDATLRIMQAIEKYPPGESGRWERIFSYVIRMVEATENDPEPVQLDITKDVLKAAMSLIYLGVNVGSSDSLTLLREILPEMYKKHSPERGMRISMYQRNEMRIVEEGYAYGELDYEMFATIYEKLTRTYGVRRNGGVFYDLGSGVGQLVYAAAILGNFRKCVGIEILSDLVDRAKKRGLHWKALTSKEDVPQRIRTVDIQWVIADILERKDWTDANFIVLHWTAFPKKKLASVGSILSRCQEGTFCVSFTNPIPSPDFRVLVSDKCQVSWGITDYFVQEKVPSLYSTSFST